MVKSLLKTILSLAIIFSLCLTALAGQKHSVSPQTIENSLGVIVLGKHYGEQDFIQIYNPDGSLWYKFTYYYDDKGGQFPYRNSEFQPFAFHPDYFVLALRCVRKVRDQYEVIVNEKTGLKKYIKADDPALAFETWDRHILKVFSVDFNPSKNPLRETRQGQRKKIPLQDTFFHPVKIAGDWLMVKWEKAPRNKAARGLFEFGWIKWKENNYLLVELVYID